MSGIVDDLLDVADDILEIRDDLGAALKETWIVTRKWSGSERGDGVPTETRVRMLPSPRVVEYTHDLRIREGGVIQAGDIMLKMISRNLFTKDQVLLAVSHKNVEKFYEVGGKLYRVISVTEKYLTWNAQLRPLSNQAR